jgi:hypothetical protein
MHGLVVNRDEVAWRVVDDEAVVVHSKTSDYFSLNQSGTWLWGLMADAPRTPAYLVDALSLRYARAAAETAPDVSAFLDRLVGVGLVREEAPAVPPDPAPSAAGPPRDGYEPPQLVKFGDLETLILSGE